MTNSCMMRSTTSTYSNETSPEATRNRIAHGYAYIDLAIIRDTVEHDLPEFEQLLRTTLT